MVTVSVAMEVRVSVVTKYSVAVVTEVYSEVTVSVVVVYRFRHRVFIHSLSQKSGTSCQKTSLSESPWSEPLEL